MEPLTFTGFVGMTPEERDKLLQDAILELEDDTTTPEPKAAPAESTDGDFSPENLAWEGENFTSYPPVVAEGFTLKEPVSEPVKEPPFWETTIYLTGKAFFWMTMAHVIFGAICALLAVAACKWLL